MKSIVLSLLNEKFQTIDEVFLAFNDIKLKEIEFSNDIIFNFNWAQCELINDIGINNIFFKNGHSDFKTIVLSDIIDLVPYSVIKDDESLFNNIIIDEDYSLHQNYQKNYCICLRCSCFIRYDFQFPGKNSFNILRAFKNFKSLREHTGKHHQSIKYGIFNVKLNPKAWSLIKFRENGNYFFINKIGDVDDKTYNKHRKMNLRLMNEHIEVKNPFYKKNDDKGEKVDSSEPV